MSSIDTLKRLKVKNCFAYHESKVSDSEIEFGWKELKPEEVELPIVVSYGSKSKSVSKEDAEWSKGAGVNAASYSDYVRYFTALTGDSPADFYDKWNDNLEDLEKIRASANPQYRDGEGKFLVSLSNLLNNGVKFSQYGRLFKLIEK